MCGSAAHWSLDSLRTRNLPPELVVKAVEYVRVESLADQWQGMFDKGIDSQLQASDEEIAELNEFLAQAWMVLGKKEVDITDCYR